MHKARFSRRRIVTGLMTFLGLPGWALSQTSAQPKPLDEKDPQALTLGYMANAAKVDAKTNPTYQPGQTCSNCVLLVGNQGDAFRPCNVFPGKLVAVSGWCRSWVKKG